MFMQQYLICYFACCNIHYVVLFLILFFENPVKFYIETD